MRSPGWLQTSVQSGFLSGTPGIPNTPAPPSTPLFHEIMAYNATAITNGGACPDWIELRNLTSQTVDLTGRYLSDEPQVDDEAQMRAFWREWYRRVTRATP